MLFGSPILILLAPPTATSQSKSRAGSAADRDTRWSQQTRGAVFVPPVTHMYTEVLRGSRVSPNVKSTTSVFESAVVLFVGDSQFPRRGPLRCVSKRFEFSQEFIGIVRPFSNAP